MFNQVRVTVEVGWLLPTKYHYILRLDGSTWLREETVKNKTYRTSQGDGGKWQRNQRKLVGFGIAYRRKAH